MSIRNSNKNKKSLIEFMKGTVFCFLLQRCIAYNMFGHFVAVCDFPENIVIQTICHIIIIAKN